MAALDGWLAPRGSISDDLHPKRRNGGGAAPRDDSNSRRSASGAELPPKKGHARPATTGGRNFTQAGGEDSEFSKKVLSRLKAAAYTDHGADWTKLFREQDKNHSGKIDWPEFLSMCRRVLRLTDPDGSLLHLFKSIDTKRRGYITIGKLVAYVEGATTQEEASSSDVEDTPDVPGSQRSSPLAVESPASPDGFWDEFAMSDTLRSQSMGSPSGGEDLCSDALVRLLVHQYGCMLCAWREELDRHECGRVTCKNFARTCHRNGFSAKETRALWRELSPHGHALEFADLAPQQEVRNLEDYAECLRYNFYFDLDAAWRQMDTSSQNFLVLADFTRGAAWMNFEGDAKLLFRGLVAPLTKRIESQRITRKEFFYIKLVVQDKKRYLPEQSQLGDPISDFRVWASQRFKSPAELITALGLSEGNDANMRVKDMVAYLTALGYQGDARHVAVKAASTQPSSRGIITAASLYAALNDIQTSPAQDASSLNYSPAARATTVGTAKVSSPAGRRKERTWSPSAKQAWDNSLDDISIKNSEKCQAHRVYFPVGPAAPGGTSPSGRPLRRAMSAQRRAELTADLWPPEPSKAQLLQREDVTGDFRPPPPSQAQHLHLH